MVLNAIGKVMKGEYRRVSNATLKGIVGLGIGWRAGVSHRIGSSWMLGEQFQELNKSSFVAASFRLIGFEWRTMNLMEV